MPATMSGHYVWSRTLPFWLLINRPGILAILLGLRNSSLVTVLTALILLLLTLSWGRKLSFAILQDTLLSDLYPFALLRPSRKCFLYQDAYSFLSAFRWANLSPCCGSLLKTQKQSLQSHMLTVFYPVIQVHWGGTRLCSQDTTRNL